MEKICEHQAESLSEVYCGDYLVSSQIRCMLGGDCPYSIEDIYVYEFYGKLGLLMRNERDGVCENFEIYFGIEKEIMGELQI